MPFIERRRAQRFDFQLPLSVRWAQGFEVREAHTNSEDVSSKGIYFCFPEGIQEGTSVELMLTMPHDVTLAGPLRVRCFGRVQRCEPGKGATARVAASIQRYEFLRRNESAA